MRIEKDGIEIVYLDPSYRYPVRVKKESDIARSSMDERPSGGEAANRHRDNPPNDKVNSPAPTHHYSPTELGPEEMAYFEPGDEEEPDGDYCNSSLVCRRAFPTHFHQGFEQFRPILGPSSK